MVVAVVATVAVVVAGAAVVEVDLCVGAPEALAVHGGVVGPVVEDVPEMFTQ